MSSSEPGHFIVFKSDVPAGVIHYEIIVQRDARPREMNGLKYMKRVKKKLMTIIQVGHQEA